MDSGHWDKRMFRAEVKERLALFENKNFFLFTVSGLFATFGNGLNYIALSWLAYNKTDSVKGVAIMMFCIWMPSILFAPLFGLLADRYNRKAQIIISNLVRGIVIVAWVLMWEMNIEPDLMILCSLLGVFISFYMPSAVPFIQSIVSEEDLVSANATIDMVYEFGTIVGMGLSGFILAVVGIKGTLLIGGILFIIAGLFNLAMRTVVTSENANKQSGSWWYNYTSSLRYFKSKPALFMPYMSQMIIMVLLMTIPIILVPYTREVLHASTRVFALYEALYSLGVLAGGFLSPVLCKKISIRKTLALLLLVMAGGLYILSVNDAVILVFPIYFLIGFGISSWALSISLSQLHCAPEYQGRLQATFNGLSGIFILAIYLLMAKEGNGLSSQGVYLAQSVLALTGIVIVLFYRKGEHRES
ncbi:MFS transporter [Salmonella enterica]